MAQGGMRPYPEALYYHIAFNAVQSAKSEPDEFKRKQLGAIAMVFCALCLEAFINQRYRFAAKPPSAKKGSKGASLKDKWLRLPLLLECGETFDESRDPFLTFEDIVFTRNKRLVHFQPYGETQYSGEKYDRRYFGDLVGDVGLAEKYVQCVAEMIRELNRLTMGQTGLPGFLGGDKYLSEVWSDATFPFEIVEERSIEEEGDSDIGRGSAED